MCSEWNEDLERMLEIQREFVLMDNIRYVKEEKWDYHLSDTDAVQYEQQGPL